MTDDSPPVPRVRAFTGILVETGFLMVLLLFAGPTAIVVFERLHGGVAPDELWLFITSGVVLAVVVFFLTLWVSRLVVGRAGAAVTRRWVAWECVRYALLGFASGLVLGVAFTSSWLRWEGIVLVLAGVALVPVAMVGVGRMRRWRDREYREQLLSRLADGFVVVEGAVIDSRSSGRMTDMTTIGWRDDAGGTHYARILTGGLFIPFAPVSLILRASDQSRLVHAAQQIG
ncbi:hypothetical protein GCM10028820_11490 [Tessaracoccus terricola]